jgi:malate dehydrogenase (oxaloacetate-decarboxylating)(NADP+)
VFALQKRTDAIVANGRSDFPNQVNNVLCFPFIFRGALDVHASEITLDMMKAAVAAIAQLVKAGSDPDLTRLYPEENFEFGASYILPKPFDPRLCETVASAVALAAMKGGVAQKPIKNWETYQSYLQKRKSQN